MKYRASAFDISARCYALVWWIGGRRACFSNLPPDLAKKGSKRPP